MSPNSSYVPSALEEGRAVHGIPPAVRGRGLRLNGRGGARRAERPPSTAGGRQNSHPYVPPPPKSSRRSIRRPRPRRLARCCATQRRASVAVRRGSWGGGSSFLKPCLRARCHVSPAPLASFGVRWVGAGWGVSSNTRHVNRVFAHRCACGAHACSVCCRCVLTAKTFGAASSASAKVAVEARAPGAPGPSGRLATCLVPHIHNTIPPPAGSHQTHRADASRASTHSPWAEATVSLK